MGASIGDSVGTCCLLEFGAKKNHENYYPYSYDCECSVSDIPVDPVVTTGNKVNVGVEETKATSNKKYKRQNHKKYEHG